MRPAAPLAALLPPLLLLLLLPSVQAGLAVEVVSTPAQPLTPEVDEGHLVVRVAVDCADLWSRSQPATVTAAVEAPPVVILSAGPLSDFSRDDCPLPDGVATRDWNASFLLTRDAPAWQDQPLSVTFDLPAGDAAPAATATVEETVSARAVPVLRVMVPSTILGTSDGRADFRLDVANQGNAALDVRVEQHEQTDPVLRLEEPAPLRLEPGQTAQLNVTLVGSGSWQEAIARLTLVGRDVASDAESEPVYVNLLVRDTSIVGRVTPGPPLPLLVLAVAALVVRRR